MSVATIRVRYLIAFPSDPAVWAFQRIKSSGFERPWRRATVS
jgi:hypothetical protein